MTDVAGRLAGLSREERALLFERLREKRERETEAAPPPLPRNGDPPLSFAQQRLWFLDRLMPGNPFYNLSGGGRLTGLLEVGTLRRALWEVVRRHETLRTGFAEADGTPVQRIAPEPDLEVPVVDLSGLVPEEREAEILHLAAERAREPFDLTRPGLLRLTLLRLEGGESPEHVLLWILHHIISDAWSNSVLAGEVTALYAAFLRGEPSPLPELPLQYADFTLWQRNWLSGEVIERQLAYWREQLAGASGTELPTDRPRPPVQSFRGSNVLTLVPAGTLAGVAALARSRGLSTFMILLGAFQVLLMRHSGEEDVVVGSPVANRTRPALERLIGFFVNTLVLRTDCAGDPSFEALLDRVKRVALSAYAHQDLPFEQLVEELKPRRDLSRNPLFQIAFNLVNTPAPRIEVTGDLEMSPLPVPGSTSLFDLQAAMVETPEGLAIAWEHATDLFDRATIERLARHFETLLAGVVAGPGRRLSNLPLLTPAERHQLVAWNDTQEELGAPACLHGLFFARAEAAPGAPALLWQDGEMTYGELALRVRRLAGRLAARGIGPGHRVAIPMEPSAERAAAVLAVLAAGAAYVPLDPAYPRERLEFMLEDSGASLLPPDGEEEWAGALPPAAGPDDLAYIIYTSGSTGRPKGVMVRHAAAVNTIRDVNRRFGVGPEDRVLALSSLAFDLSVYDLFGMLAAGGALVLPRPSPTPDPASWTGSMARHGVTLWNSAPALMELLLSSGGLLPQTLRLVLLSGDWIPLSLPDQIRRQVPGARVISLGGATEGAIWSILYPVGAVGPAWTSIPYGRPMANQAFHVLDDALRPVPVGVVGELWIGGDGVADGYFARPDLTAERFVPDPFDGRPGVRLYRTGDLGRRFADGVIEFLGRRDHQVKVRGFRIELGEIESVLASHPAVQEAVAAGRREEGAPRGSGQLVAYVVPKNGEVPGDLRAWLAARLPDPMVPSGVVQLDRLPLSANGKVDRRALPAPGAGPERSRVPPTTDTERTLAGIWTELLKIDRMGREDHFFELGGHSLLATQVAARVREIFGIELPLAVLFQETTLEALSRTVDARLASEGVGERAPEIRPVPREGDLPLSFAQQRLWFLDRLMPGTPFYSLAGGVRLTGPLEIGALSSAVQEVVRRHETLRTGFPEVGGRPVQRIVPGLKIEVPVLDFADLPPEEREAAVRRIAGERTRAPFDLTRPGLLRVTLLRLRGGERPEHVLLWAIHHIVSDAWSNAVLMDEVAALYAGQALPELPVQYADFAVWQREWLSGERLLRQLAYWRERLAGVPVLELPADRPRPPVQTFRGATYRVLYGRPLLDSLNALSRRRDASLFMTLLAAFDVLLCRFTGQEDVAVGTPIANRTQPVLERLIGFFINTLVLRTDCAGDPPFVDLLARVKEAALGAYAHQDLPFEQLVEGLQPRRDLSRNPLFQVMLNLLNAPSSGAEVDAGLEMSPLPPADGTALFDLQAYALEEPEGLRIAWEHNSDLFDRGTIERLSRSFETLLAWIVERPEAPLHDLPLLSPEERDQILVRWNDTAAPLPEPATVHALFEAQATRTPHAVALVFEGETLTYAELNARANRAAHHLRSLGVGPEVLVALRLERSVPLVLAVLAVLKAGGAYVPLDPSLPAERLAFLLEDSQAALALTELEEAEDASDPAPSAGPGNLAYVLYTSGSTGRPKGVEVTHRGVVNFLASVARRPGLTADDAVLAVTTLSFDIAAYELLLPLTVGARVVLVTRETALDGERLAAVLSAEGVTRVQVTPATWRLLLGSGWDGDPRLMALSGGEALPRDLARELLPRAGSLWNFYGPTETTIWSSVHRVEDAEGAIPIGLPVANTAIHLLDRRLEPVPLGVAGELYIGGAGVSRGYLRRPDLTAERFLPDPFSSGGERLYRTGDLARRRSTGEIEFLGRADHQVKIRGFRVEPGEIEAVLAEDPAVRQAAVVLREVDGDPRLVAWLVWEEGREGDPRALRERLRKRVPEYMIPSAFISLAALPLTPSGKVDRRALAAREDAADRPLSFAALFVPPRTPAEQQMAGLFAEVLALRGEPVGAHDNFFERGGHSLLATRLVSRVRAAFGVDLPLRTLFEAQTVAGLTAAVLAQGRGAQEPGIRPLHATEAPLSFSQERLWFLERLLPGTATYSLPSFVRLRGPLAPAPLALAFAEIVRRHEALRTRFLERSGVPVQVVDPPGRHPLPLVDLSALPEPELGLESGRLVREEAARPFDLTSGPVLRTTLLRLGIEEHGLLVDVHHIATDGWSQNLLLRELAVLYEAFSSGVPSPLPELPVQYADYAVWQRGRLAGEELERQLAYWRERLGGNPPSLDLPLDRPRPAVQTFRGATVFGVLPRDLSESLARLAQAQGASLFMVLLAGFKLLLHRQSGQDDVLVGTPIAGRLRPEVEDLIGFFLNTLVLRTDLGERPTFRELLSRVRETALSAYAHQDVPFEKLLEELQPERDLSRTPLFQVFFNMLNIPSAELRLPGGLALEPLGGEAGDSKFDLTVYVAEREEGIALHLVYNADLFEAARVEELVRQYRSLLAQAVEQPDAPVDRISLLTPEAVPLLPDPRAPLGEAWHGAVHELFAARAARHPERPALSDPEGAWTYGDLAHAVDGLAARLREAGGEKGDRVAVWAHRSAPVVWAVMGILRAGGAFVMLDPAYPAARIVEMLRLAGPRAFLGIAAAGEPPDEVDAWLRETGIWRLTLPGGGPEGARALSLPETAPEVEIGPDDLAYVAFTSGSTGVPKGILGRHGPLSHFIPWQAERFGLDGEDRYSLLSGLAHDPLQRDMFTPLATGASLAAPAPDDLLVPGRLAAWAAREGITVSHLTPALGRVMTEGESALILSLRWVLLVGDVLTRLDVDRLRRIAPSVTCVNLYGSTETQRAVAFHMVEKDGAAQVLPLGRGMPDVQLLVVRPGEEPALAGIGEVGEICVRSPHLAAGYLGDEAGTRERFRTNPFTDDPGDRIYRTGDLGRYRPDGQVTFAGRADHQVKIRGFRIELGEIEAALGRLPGVKEAVVLALSEGEDRRLVAFVAGETAVDLRQALAAKLPAYMVPSAFVRLERMPVTPNGKVDRRALAVLKDQAEGPGSAFVPPRTPAEQQMAGIWAEVLGLAEDRVGAHDNFFELGGHSLLATRLASRVQAAFGADLPLRALFETPSVAALTAVVLAAAGQGEGRVAPISRRAATEVPLSFSQERLWFLERLTPGTGMYNLPGAARLRGPLDPAALEHAFGEIVRRHETLRTRFEVRAGLPVQVVAPPAPWSLPVVDLSGLPESLAESERLAAEEAARPFDLQGGRLLRTTLLRLGPGEHALLVTVHHIASDGWSQRLLFRELAAGYAGAPLPELPVQSAEYAVWQRERLAGETLEHQLAFWRERLGDRPPPLDLPLDRPRPAIQTFRGAAAAAALPRDLSERLQALSVAESASLFMVLLAGFELLLHRQSGQDDVVVGTPVAGRLRPEVEDLIGFFLNTLVLRTGLSGRPTFRELVRRVRETALSAYAHQDIPFERLLQEIQPERDLSRTPFFQVFFNMLNLPPAEARLPSGLALEPLGTGAGDAKFDLTVYAAQGEEGIGFNLVYNADLFDEARMEELLRQYRALLAQAVERPDEPMDGISLVTPEAVALLPDPRAPLGDAWRGAVHTLFAEQARRHPERPAVTDPEGTTTYGELAYAVRRLAARLRESGVEKGDRVAIWAHRSSPVAWAVLAALEAGGAFVMLDPAYPAPRIVEMLELAAPRAFLAVAAAGDPPPEVEAWLAEAGLACRVTLPGGGPRGARELVASLPPPVPPVEVGPDDLAYVAFTSGSTGTPKGILGRHGPLSHFLPWQAERLALRAGDRYSLLSGLAHDPLQRDLFTPLCLGGSLAVPSFEEIATPGRLAAWMAREGITVAHLTPALGQLLTEPPGRGAEPATIPSLCWVLLVGDVLTRLDVDRIRRIAPNVTCVNLYGSTETQRAVAFHVVEPSGDRARQVLPLGRGMEDVQLLVVRPGEEPALAGVGEVGEIWVRSPHLAAGYLGDPELTGDRFRTNPWTGASGDRVYRTGDLGRYLPDGEVAFAGRADQQVKIRGFRIEPGEIEAALGRLPGVREAVVIARQDGPEAADRRLVAYVVPDPASPPAVEALREALRGRLPAYMVPGAFVLLEKLPLTPNRKVDRRALPAPEAPGAGAGFVEPGSDLERTIAEVWREVLGVERVGVQHNFFDLGGHSLLLVRLHVRLQEALGRDLALVDLFNYPNIRALAEHLGRQDGGPTGLDEARSRGQRQMEAARRQRELARARRGPRRNTDE